MSGAMKILAFEYCSLLKALTADPASGLEDSVLSKMQALTDDELSDFISKVGAWHVDVDANDEPKIVVIPPGFFVCLCMINGPACGICKPFLSFGERAVSSMPMLASTTRSAKVFLDLMKAEANSTTTDGKKPAVKSTAAKGGAGKRASGGTVKAKAAMKK